MYVMVKDKSGIIIDGPASANIANSDWTPLALSTSARHYYQCPTILCKACIMVILFFFTRQILTAV
jgi:hypothetical protein